jgi:hypothetical protein
LQPGIYCDVITGGKMNGACVGKMVQVNNDGKADIEISATDEMPVLAIHDDSKL